MKLDVPTLMLQTLVFEVSMALLMLLHVRHRKVYAGFGLWTASTFAVAVTYLGMVLRPWIPLSSVPVVVAATSLAAVMRWDGVLRFTGRGAVARRAYLIPPLLALTSTALALSGWSASARSVPFAFVIGTITLLNARTLLRVSGAGRSLYVTAAALATVQALGMMGRSVAWCLHPEVGEFDPVALQSVFYGMVIVSEVGITSAFLMLNSLRLEQDLIAAQGQRAKTLHDLQETVASLKILRGLLSLCSCCKKVRIASQTWEAVEVYVSRHADVEFSHGVCEDCLHLHYGAYRGKEPPRAGVETEASGEAATTA